MPQLSLHTPVGDLTVSEEAGALVAVDWGWGRDQTPTPLLCRACDQLHAYFDDDHAAFDLVLKPAQTAFQQRVRGALCAIPRGEVTTYGELAKRLESSPRAVGAACGANPIPIIVPCHRVVGQKGALHGYSGDGGLRTKEHLLILEGAIAPRVQQDLLAPTP